MNFSDLGLSKRATAALEKIGFVEPTEIQEKTIPVVLAGQDLMASAETGSGKTAAYAVPILQFIKNNSEKLPRILVLVPTRELAVQVQTEFDRFANGCGMRSVTIYGGTGYDKQTRILKRGVDVVVATPGRLFDHIKRNNVDLSNVKTLVLDEADRMLDMGFMPQVKQIVKYLQSREQTLMFSATIDKKIEQTAAVFLRDPVRVAVNTERLEPVAIEQRAYHVTEDEKNNLLIELIKDKPEVDSVIVFARTRGRVKRVKKFLTASDVVAEEIHGDVSQNKRDATLKRYRSGEFSVLVATDVAARGLDIPSISHVINYDLPDSAPDFVHRIGRTGRAGRSGIALSFVSREQRHLVRDIEKVTGRKMEMVGEAPTPEPGEENSKRRKARKQRKINRSGRHGEGGDLAKGGDAAVGEMPVEVVQVTKTVRTETVRAERSFDEDERNAFGTKNRESGGRGNGQRTTGGAARSFKDKPRYGERARYGDKPSNGDKPRYGEKPRYGDKPSNGDKPRYGEKPRYGDKPSNGDKPRYGEKPRYSDKPSNGDKPRYGEKPRYGDKPSNGDKPRYGEKPRYGDKPSNGDHRRDKFGRSPRQNQDGKPSFGRPSADGRRHSGSTQGRFKSRSSAR